MTPEELDKWLASLPAPEEDDCPHVPDADPYFKLEQKSDEQRSNRWFGKMVILLSTTTVRRHFPKSLLPLSPGRPPTALMAAMTEPAACLPSFLTT